MNKQNIIGAPLLQMLGLWLLALAMGAAGLAAGTLSERLQGVREQEAATISFVPPTSLLLARQNKTLARENIRVTEQQKGALQEYLERARQTPMGTFTPNPVNPLSGAVRLEVPNAASVQATANGHGLGKVGRNDGLVLLNWLFEGENQVSIVFLDENGAELARQNLAFTTRLPKGAKDGIEVVRKGAPLPNGADGKGEVLLLFHAHEFEHQVSDDSFIPVRQQLLAYDRAGNLRGLWLGAGSGAASVTPRENTLLFFETVQFLQYNLLTHQYESAGVIAPYLWHHDFILSDRNANRVFLLADLPGENTLSNYLLEFDAEKNVVAKVIDFRERLPIERPGIADEFLPPGVNWLHANSVFHDEAHGQYIFSSRAQSAVFALDGEDFSLLWILAEDRDWPPEFHGKLVVLPPEVGPMSGQHDARILPDGRLSIFDNRAMLPDGKGGWKHPETVRSRQIFLDLGPDGRPVPSSARTWEPLPVFSKVRGGGAPAPDGRFALNYGGICKDEFGHLILSRGDRCPRKAAVIAEFPSLLASTPDLQITMEGPFSFRVEYLRIQPY